MDASTPVTATTDRPGEVEGWFTPGRFALVLAAGVLALYPEVILGTRTFVFRDYGLFGYPLAYYHQTSFWRGEVPLWNPLNDCGLPFLAQWNTMVFYPLSLFYLFLPLSWALGVFCLLHQFLAGMGMYFLAREWSGHQAGAALAGIAFAFNGLTMNCLMWPNNIAGLGWMPWVVWGAERAWRQGGWRIVVAALAGAAQMLSGAPEVILFTWLLVLLNALGQWILEPIPCVAAARRLFCVVLVVSALAAVQLIPFLDFLAHSQRSPTYATSENAMPPTGWASLLVPYFRAYRSPQHVYFQPGQTWTSSYYAGVGVLALALLAAGQGRQWRVRLLWSVGLTSLILALGDAGYLYAGLRRLLPFTGFMSFPIKFVVLVAFVFPLLAAFGLRGLLSRQPHTRRLWAVGLILGTLIGLILWFAFRYPDYYERWNRIRQSGLTRALFLGLTLGLVPLLVQGKNAGMRALVGLGLLAVTWLDLATHVPRQNPTAARGVLEPGLANLRQLSPHPSMGESRAMLSAEALRRFEKTYLADPANTYLGHRLGMYFNCNLLEGIAKVDGMFSLYLREQLQVQFALYAPTNSYAQPLADFMAVSQISAPGDPLAWQARPTQLPLITGGQKPLFADAEATVRELISTNFNPRDTVILPVELQPFVSATNGVRVIVRNRQFAPHQVAFEIEAGAASLVVVAQSYYHPWQAEVDGKPVPLWRANHAFQALEVPAGRHHVRLIYVDWGFRWGALISGVTLLGCAGYGGWRWKKQGRLDPQHLQKRSS